MRALAIRLQPRRGAALARALAASVLVALGAGASAQEGVVVICHPSNPAAAISRHELSRYFLRQSSEWPSGQRVRPVDQPRGSPARTAFTEKLLGRTVGDMDAFWAQAFYSGRAVPPPMKSDDAGVVEYVRSTPGAVGYVQASASPEGVKKLPVRD